MTMLYGTSYGTSPLALRALPLRKGDTSEIIHHKSNIIHQNINHHEQKSLAKNPEHRHHGAYRHRHHLWRDLLHGHLNKTPGRKKTGRTSRQIRFMLQNTNTTKRDATKVRSLFEFANIEGTFFQ